MAMLNDVRKLPQMGDIVTELELDEEYGIATIHFNNGVSIRAHTFNPAEDTEPWPDFTVPKIPSDDEILKQTEPLVGAVAERIAMLIRQGKVKGYKYVGDEA